MFVLIVEVVAPVLHSNAAEPVPPAGVAVKVAAPPWHVDELFTETVGFRSMASVPALEPVQPFVSVTVTL